MKTFEQLIIELKKIKREKLTKRRFYEEVLNVMIEFDDVIRVALRSKENYEQLLTTLSEIGCKSPKELTEKAKYSSVGEALETGSVEFADNCIAQYYFSQNSAEGWQKYIMENKWIHSWLAKSYEFSSLEEYTLTSPYHKVAKTARMNWDGLSEEEAEREIRTLSVEELDKKVDAQGSMNAAICCIAQKLVLPKSAVKNLKSIVYEGISEKNMVTRAFIQTKLESKNIVTIYMDTLFAVHNQWVIDKYEKFLAREKKHQHMPSELIGWKELRSDLVFVRPIYEALGIYVTEHALEEEYMKRVQKYFLKNHLEKTEDLEKLIEKGEDFYPALKGQKDNLAALQDKTIVREKVVPQIEAKGIGRVEDVRKMIVERISYTVTGSELSGLTNEELTTVATLIRARLEQVPEDQRTTNRQYIADAIRLEKVQNYTIRRRIKEKSKTQQ